MLPHQTVERAVLIDQLTSITDPALTAIVAPAGYGKTTTAVQLCERLGGPMAWIALEASDNDPARFWTYVTAALAVARVHGVEPAYDLVSGGTSGVSEAISHLCASVEKHADQTGESVKLVLDDLQAIEDPALHQQLSEVLRHPVGGLHLIAVSRSDLPLPVGRLRSQGLLAEARVNSLMLSDSEAAQLLTAGFGLASVGDGNLQALLKRTEGWPVGIYLAGLGLQDETDVDDFVTRFAGDTRHLSEYLAAEAVDALSPDQRAFLMTTSVASTLTADQCDALTGQPGSLGMLRSLVRDNMFTSALNSESTAFRYHPLFREHMVSTFEAEHPETFIQVHSRASLWYERSGDIDRAIGHATSARDSDRAKKLIADNWLIFSDAGHIATLEAWVRALGPDAHSDAITCLMMCWALLNLHRYEEIDEWEAAALAAGANGSDDERTSLRIEGAVIRSHQGRHLGDVGSMLQQAQRAVDNADFERQPIAGQLPDRVLASSGSALAVQGIALHWNGDFAQASEALVAAIAHARDVGELSSVVLGYGYLAMTEAIKGNHELALAHADQALGLVSESTERFHAPAIAHVARGWALVDQGRPADAAAASAHARRILATSKDPLIEIMAELQSARTHHLAGDQPSARAALRAARSLADSLPDPRTDERIRTIENEVRFKSLAPGAIPGGDLTDRERAVLALLPHKLSRRDLAAQLHVSENTIKTHLTSIRHKLAVEGRASIAERAIDLGLLPDPAVSD